MWKLLAYVLFPPTLCWNLLQCRVLHRWRWWDRINDHLIVGALPFPGDVSRLHEEGIRAVVNTCREYAGPLDEYRRFGIQQLRIPTTDFTPPELQDVTAAVSFIEGHVQQGESVYVHCKAGRGRGATVAICWLMASQQISPEKAQELLVERRPQTMRKLSSRQVVQQFHASLNGKKLRKFGSDH